jgi:hypothetical protein
MPPSSIS